MQRQRLTEVFLKASSGKLFAACKICRAAHAATSHPVRFNHFLLALSKSDSEDTIAPEMLETGFAVILSRNPDLAGSVAIAQHITCVSMRTMHQTAFLCTLSGQPTWSPCAAY